MTPVLIAFSGRVLAVYGAIFVDDSLLWALALDGYHYSSGGPPHAPRLGQPGRSLGRPISPPCRKPCHTNRPALLTKQTTRLPGGPISYRGPPRR